MKIKIIIFFILALLGVFLAVRVVDAPKYIFNQAGLSNLLQEDKASKETVIAFGGDVMLSRVVGQKMEKYQDFAWPFRKVFEIFSSADLAAVNLESPFTSEKNHFVPTGSFSFNADQRAMAGLNLAGIDVVSLANNHFGNQGTKGMTDTFSILAKDNVGYVGAGNNFAEAHQGKILEKNNIKFGFLGYAYPETLYVASLDSPGLANMAISQAKKDITDLKTKAEVVIVLMHAGVEYVSQPNKQQRDFARAAIDAGADLVVGHHPHWAQITEIYKNKLILYSLGNLVFDQMWSKETQEGAIAKVYFKDKELSRAEIIPIEIEDYGQPKIITDEKQKQEVLNQMELDQSEIKLIK